MAQFTLDGSEKRIEVYGMYTSIKNNGDSVMYASPEPGVDPAKETVTPIQPGESVVIHTDYEEVFVLGTGDVAVLSGNKEFNFFKPAPKGGGGGGGVTQQQLSDTLKAYATNASVDTKLEDYAEKSDIPTSLPANGGNADTVGGKSAEELTQSNPNLLINPDFKINQRGKSEYVGIMKTVDGWENIHPLKTYVVSDGVKLICENNQGFVQYLNWDSSYVGKSYTLTICYKTEGEANYSVSAINGSRMRLENSNAFTTVSFSINYETAGDPNVLFIAISGFSGAIYIKWMKLEEGSAATSFIPPDPMVEILKCRPISDEEQKLLNGAGKWVDIPANGEVRSIDVELGSDCNELIGKNGSVTTYRLRGTSFVNTPSGLPTFQGTLIAVNFMPGWIKQIFVSAHVGRTFFRYYDNGWSEWEESISKKALEKDLEHLNLLDNPDFKINQRGLTEYKADSGVFYTVDRWKSQQWFTVNAESDCITVTLSRAVEVESNVSGFWQYIEYDPSCGRKECVASIFVEDISSGNNIYAFIVGLANGVVKVSSNFVTLRSGLNTIKLSDTKKLTDECNRIQLTVNFKKTTPVGEFVKIKWAKLEFGTTQTPFVPPNPALELLRCQRYYYNPLHNNTGNAMIAYRTLASTSTVVFPLPLPCVMRLSPSADSTSIDVYTGSKWLTLNTIVRQYTEGVTHTLEYEIPSGEKIDVGVYNVRFAPSLSADL